jgi:hypothetical protein
MRKSNLSYRSLACLVLAGLFLAALSGCKDLWRKEPERKPVARVGERFLYQDDLQGLLAEGLSPEDSAAFVSSYINNWATKELLFSKAQLNLPPEKIAEYEALVAEYRADLYTRAYKEALVAQAADTLIRLSELDAFYEGEKENFKLQEKLVQLRFIELPKQFLNKDEVTRRLRRFNPEDLRFLDSVGVQFRKLNFNDSLWVPAARVIEEIPPLTPENEAQYLKKSQFFELEDDQGVYLAEVIDVLNVNDIAPLSYIEPTIRQVLLNRRKMTYLRSLETDLINEAIQRKEFEIYDQNPK